MSTLDWETWLDLFLWSLDIWQMIKCEKWPLESHNVVNMVNPMPETFPRISILGMFQPIPKWVCDEVTNSADRELMAGAFFAFNCLMPLRWEWPTWAIGNTGRPDHKNGDCKMVYGRIFWLIWLGITIVSRFESRPSLSWVRRDEFALLYPLDPTGVLCHVEFELSSFWPPPL